MTDLSSSNGAASSGAGDLPMSDTSGTGAKRGGAAQSVETGATESASFDAAPSVTQPSTSAGGSTRKVDGGASGAQSSGSDEEQSRLRASLKSIEARSQELRRWAASQQDTAREVIEDRPVAVIASAFGIGLVLGVLAAKL